MKKKASGGIVESIKVQLWRHGFKVKEVSGLGTGYDLLVEGKYRVRVFSASEAEPSIMAKNCDVAAIVFGDRKAYSFPGEVNGEKFSQWNTNPVKIFQKSGRT